MPLQKIIPRIHFSVQSGPFAAREALTKLMEGLAPLGLDIEEAGTVELVLAEALNNIVEHGYPDQDSSGPINLSCTHASSGLNIQLIDEGIPMPDGKTPIGLAPDTDVDFMDMPEGGFGWFIIKDLAKDILYKRMEKSNCLNLRIAVALGSNR